MASILRDIIRRDNRPKDTDDESVSSPLARRFGHKFERIFGSALIHGVYAADARALSVRATFPTLLEAEERGRGSIVRGMLRTGSNENVQQYDLGNVENTVKDDRNEVNWRTLVLRPVFVLGPSALRTEDALFGTTERNTNQASQIKVLSMHQHPRKGN